MEQFIEVHAEGKKRLINLRWVEEICENLDGCATIYFAFNCPNPAFNRTTTIEQDYIKVDESYSELLNEIWR